MVVRHGIAHLQANPPYRPFSKLDYKTLRDVRLFCHTHESGYPNNEVMDSRLRENDDFSIDSTKSNIA
jgi:hypothetical protein